MEMVSFGLRQVVPQGKSEDRHVSSLLVALHDACVDGDAGTIQLLVKLGFGRSVTSEKEVPIIFANLV
jgi:hypothetical protein